MPLKCTKNCLIYNIKVMHLKQGIFTKAAKKEGIGLPPSQRTKTPPCQYGRHDGWCDIPSARGVIKISKIMVAFLQKYLHD
jgi:hypothetical protein